MYANWFLYGLLALGFIAALWKRWEDKKHQEQEERFWKALPEAWVKKSGAGSMTGT